MSFKASWTPQFHDVFRKGEPAQYRTRAQEVIARLLLDPYRAARSEPLRAEYRGKRSAHLTKKLRIIFTICEECRREGLQELNNLPCCWDPNADPKTVVFLTVVDYH